MAPFSWRRLHIATMDTVWVTQAQGRSWDFLIITPTNKVVGVGGGGYTGFTMFVCRQAELYKLLTYNDDTHKWCIVHDLRKTPIDFELKVKVKFGVWILHYSAQLRNEWVFLLCSWEMNLGESRDKSREPRSSSQKICHCLTQVHFPWMQENKTLTPYIYNVFHHKTFF